MNRRAKQEENLQEDLSPVQTVADATFGSVQPHSLPDKNENLRHQFVEDAQERDERSKKRD